MKDIVAIAYIKERKVLIVQSVRSSRQNLFTLVGGGVESNEALSDACVRESKEEVSKYLDVSTKSFEEIITYTEGAASDPSLEVCIHIFLSNKVIDIDIKPTVEIVGHKFINSTETEVNISSSVQRFIEYAKDLDLID